MKENTKYIYVDLDGTLISTDLLFESALMFIRRNPFNIFFIVIWIFKGKAALKEKLAQKVEINVEELPYLNEVIEYLIEKKKEGFKLVLATASHISYAQKIADHLKFFDDVIASNGNHNMKGIEKLAAIKKMSAGNDFTYVGDHSADITIWEVAASNVFVNAPEEAIKIAEKNGKIDKIFRTKTRTTPKAFIKEMRIHQWVKNILIFVPLLAAHGYTDSGMILLAMVAFICFSLCASGVYFLNDLLDIELDRGHRIKKNRPIASGDLSIPLGVLGAIILPLASFVLASVFLPIAFIVVLAIYFLITNLYSFFLKRISTADVMTLAILYTMRVIAGGAATGLVLSSWLVAFSIFVFVSLAYLKRYIELIALNDKDDIAKGRGYSLADSETMFSLGVSNITASVIVLAFYISSDKVTLMYKAPEALWGLCFLMLYWGNRIWIGARRGKISEDPIVFAIKDRVSRMIGLGFVVVVVAAKMIEL